MSEAAAWRKAAMPRLSTVTSNVKGCSLGVVQSCGAVRLPFDQDLRRRAERQRFQTLRPHSRAASTCQHEQTPTTTTTRSNNNNNNKEAAKSQRVLPFVKFHGCGNDYVLVDAWAQKVSNPGLVARIVSPRSTGIGSDGLILVGPATNSGADWRMRIFNADGSEAELCGNGLRCAAKFAFE
ncbi:unnamed protein product, partial [Polarella glacialis]